MASAARQAGGEAADTQKCRGNMKRLPPKRTILHLRQASDSPGRTSYPGRRRHHIISIAAHTRVATPGTQASFDRRHEILRHLVQASKGETEAAEPLPRRLDVKLRLDQKGSMPRYGSEYHSRPSINSRPQLPLVRSSTIHSFLWTLGVKSVTRYQNIPVPLPCDQGRDVARAGGVLLALRPMLRPPFRLTVIDHHQNTCDITITSCSKFYEHIDV